MTDKSDRISTDPGLGALDPPGPSASRSLEVMDSASISPHAPVYYEPLPLVAVSDHKTLEIETVKLSADIDPRRLVTELRLSAGAFMPASGSGWPPQTALSGSHPPTGPGRRWRTPVVLLSLLAAVLVLVLARSITRQSRAAGVSAANVALSGANVAPPPLVAAPVASAVNVPVVASAVASAPLASTDVPASMAAVVEHADLVRDAAAVHTAKHHPQSAAHSQSLSVLSSNKPKRAIY